MTTFDGLHALDALTGLKRLPIDSVDCVVTSPPYWDTRDYGPLAMKWNGGERCMLGREPTIDQYLVHLLEVFDEIRRVVKPGGTVWVNLGDVYWSGSRCVQRSTSGSGSSRKPVVETSIKLDRQNPRDMAFGSLTLPYKSLCLIPERFAVAMVARGWVLRNRIVWHKPNHLPASVKDRLTGTWEHLFLFTMSSSYAFDLDAIRVPHQSSPHQNPKHESVRPSNCLHGRRLPPRAGEPQAMHPLGKNPGDCWSIPLRPSRLKHAAAFPEALCIRPILAGSPLGGLVLDPFVGSGTTAVVAKRLGRRFIGFDSNAEYIRIAQKRLSTMTETENADVRPI